MLTVNYSRLRANLKEYCDRAADEGEPVLVTRRGGNVVILGAAEYNALVKGSQDSEAAQIRIMSSYIQKLYELLEKNGVHISMDDKDETDR